MKISQKVEIENEKVSSAQLENIGSNQLDLQIHHYRLQNGTFTQAQHFGPRVEISPTLNQVSINHNSPQLQFVPIAVGTENDTVEWPQVEFESSGELPFVANNRPDLLVDNLFTLLPDEKISTVSNSDDAQSRVEPAGLSVNQFNVAKGGSAVQLIVENLMARVNLDEIEVLEEDSNE